MNRHTNATDNINSADLAWLVLAIREALADTDEVTTPLVASRLAMLLPNQPVQEVAMQLGQLQQINVLKLNNNFWQVNADFMQQLNATTNCGCGYQAQWALTKSLLEQWV